MFRLLQNNHHQAVYWKYKKETILNIVSGRDFGLKQLITCVNIYVCFLWKALFKYKMVLYKLTHLKKIIREKCTPPDQ